MFKRAATRIPTTAKENEVWVIKWVDYSEKYGIGYSMSDESTGVYFNDSTKMLLDMNGHHFHFFKRCSKQKRDISEPFTFLNYPEELEKKVKLL